MQYEVQFKGLHPENNKWMTRDKLIEMGMEKLVAALDAKEAAAQGLYQRPLTTSVVEKHLLDLGIEPEFGTHSHIRGLSGEGLIMTLLTIEAFQLTIGSFQNFSVKVS